ncbi:flagellin [Blastopirellula marina]|uniref:Flagellin n=1 Tax=Blastopirellula marina TaxID=124 RepID=A0A2S8GAE6_9BACT|nr:flagellin [Blastopirellula marina]PQO35396.1 flagellin [Blastopirellula marina]PQO41435.1 flagellin [Blastopirellula marina]PTL44036.1 flagellin [Blastopirellula marina]
MTRINTNVSSLVAQKNLGRSNADLNTTLTRLSTGLRINSGKDDPAGLIASESLRSDITSVEKAITNSERANQLIATADSALGQVSSLLNDIRGLISEAANTGALSDDQIAANQLQIDSSLEAIDRIAQVTSFQGKRLLDGNLDFITQNVNSSAIEGLSIDQANFGTQSSIGVAVNVVKQATRAELNYGFGAVADNLVLEIGGGNGTEAFNFAKGSTIEEIASAVNLVSDATGVEAVVESAATKGELTVSSFGADNDITLTANDAGFDAGDVRIKYTKGTTTATTAAYTAPVGDDPAKLEVTLGVSAYEAASVTVDTAGNDNAFTITANQAGADLNGIQVILDNTGAKGAETVDFDADAGTLTIHKAATSTGAEIVAAVNNAATNTQVSELFTAALVETTGPGAGAGAVAATGAAGTFAGGVDGGDIIATANDVIAAINAATGNDKVTASLAAGNDGHDTVTEFSNYAYNGVAEENNRLQFLAPDDSPNIRFVSNAGSSLGIDTTSDPRVEGLSQSIIQNDDANGTFSITAKLKGTEYDGYSISFVDDANLTGGGDEFVVLDKENKTIAIHAVDGASTAQDVVDAVNNDTYVGDYFKAANFGSSDGSDVLDFSELTIPAETTGGLVSEGTLIINLETDEDGNIKTTANDLIAFFDDPSQFISDAGEAASTLAYLQDRGISITNVGGSDGSGVLEPTDTDISFATSGTELEDAQATGTTFAVNGATAQLSFTAINSGAEYDGVTVQFVNDATVTAGVDERGEYDAASKTLTFYIEEGVTSADDVKAALDGDADLSLLFSATSGGTGVVTTDDTATLTGGVVDGGTTDGAALLGNSDLENLGLTFRATKFGSDSFVSVKALSGSFNLTDQDGNTGVDRSTGTDVDVRINGIQAIGDGLKASINTSSLDLSFSVGENVEDGDNFDFQIVGGGALFQLGPDVVSNQQARLGIQSVSTATLGGVSGRLFELRSGGNKSLTSDVGGAAKVVDEVINVVTSLRGRLGAFQKTTLDSNIYSLNDTLANLTEAESSIRDADFATESAKLTRAQILVQSGTSVLGIANQNPQNVLSLLR